MKTPLEQLTGFLNSQDHVHVVTNDFDEIQYTVETKDGGETSVKLESDGISFIFDECGRFKGLINWKG